MKKIILSILAVTIAVSFAFLGCKKKEAATTEPAAKTEPAKPAPAKPVAKAGPSMDTYVKAAIELGCMSKALKDKTELPAKAAEIYKKHGFDAASYGAMAKKIASNPDAAKKIGAGLAACPK